MSVPHVIKSVDLLERLVDEPMPRDEAGKVLAFYLPMVDAWSPVEAWKTQYLQGRIHVGCAIGRLLGKDTFASAVEVGAELFARRTRKPGDESIAHWTMDQLFEELSTLIDQLLDGAA